LPTSELSSPKEIESYHKGRRNAYSHMSNIGKNHSFFVQNNLTKDGTTAPPQKPQAPPSTAKPPKKSSKT